MLKTPYIYIALGAIFALAVLLPLDSRPLMSPDETRYAEIAREMIDTGDWTVPRLNGVRYFEKPILGYWLFAASMSVFGENAFALRLIPALAALLSAFIIMALAKRFTDDRDIPGLSGAIYLSMPIVFIIATIGILDGIFSFFVTASIVCFYFASEAQKKSHCVLYLTLCGVSAGLGFLTKGFLAYALPVCAVLPYVIWRKKWKQLFTMPWLPFAVSLIVIAPWAILVHRAEPDYWNYFVIIEHWKRFTGGEEAQHAEGLWYFIPVLFVGAVQYFLLTPAVIRGFRNTAFNGFMKFLVCWCAGIFVFFSISSGKLPTYILPCFPPLAIIFGVTLLKYMRVSAGRHTVNRITAFISAFGMLALIIFISMHIHKGFYFPVFLRDEAWKLFILAACALLLIAAFVACYFEKDAVKKIYFYAAAVIPVIFASHFVIPQKVLEHKAPGGFMEEVAAKHNFDPQKTKIVSYNDFQTICWVFRKTGVYMLRPNEIAYGLEYPEHRYLSLEAEGLAELIHSRPEGGVLLVISSDRYDEKYRKIINASPEWMEQTSSKDGLSIIKY